MRVKRSGIRTLAWIALAALSVGAASVAGRAEESKPRKMVGIYIHQHWPYKRPYAARTWTLEDWRGYADGLSKLGYNTVMMWPMLETMPRPLTTSDRAYLDKTRKVIDMLHKEQGMRVWVVLCPNVGVKSEEAAKASFEKRHFFYTDTRVNPADPAAIKELVDWREQLMRPLAQVDGVAIIDSDPGGYPGSTNAEFVRLLGEHRKMLDRVRPGIELVYWMHAGWEAYARYYQTGQLVLGDEKERLDLLTRLKALNPEPWGLANGLPFAEKLGLGGRVVGFNYGWIEGEPSFPMTNFGGRTAYEGAKSGAPRGVMGNAQTHAVQLPNTFAFARGATGQPLEDADYVRFGEDLLTGQGERIVRAWRTLAGRDAAEMRKVAEELEGVAKGRLEPGRLKGFLFGSPRRFLTDLMLQLRLRAAMEEFYAASGTGQGVKSALGGLVEAAERWQRTHGYQNFWWDPRLHEALAKLHSAPVDELLRLRHDTPVPTGSSRTPFEQVKWNLREIETYTPRMLAAMKKAHNAMD